MQLFPPRSKIHPARIAQHALRTAAQSRGHMQHTSHAAHGTCSTLDNTQHTSFHRLVALECRPALPDSRCGGFTLGCRYLGGFGRCRMSRADSNGRVDNGRVRQQTAATVATRQGEADRGDSNCAILFRKVHTLLCSHETTLVSCAHTIMQLRLPPTISSSRLRPRAAAAAACAPRPPAQQSGGAGRNSRGPELGLPPTHASPHCARARACSLAACWCWSALRHAVRNIITICGGVVILVRALRTCSAGRHRRSCCRRCVRRSRRSLRSRLALGC